jgi:ribose transport system permease protein
MANDNHAEAAQYRSPKYIMESFSAFVKIHYLPIVLCLLILGGSLLSSKFLTVRNILNVLLQNSMTTITSVGMLFVIITGGIDLSVGSVFALSGCLMAGFLQDGMSMIPAMSLVLILMALLGTANGTIVSIGKVAPFVATLSMMTVVRGMAYIYQVGADRRIDGTFFTNFINSSFLMVPVPVIIMVVIISVAWFLLEKTVFGRAVYAVGGNQETSRLAGINVTLILICAYAISGIFSACSGIIMTGRLSLGTAIVGEGSESDAIAAVVVGGATLNGGRGTVLGTVMGAFIIGILVNIMNLAQIPSYQQMLTKGIIILIAVMTRRSS